MLNTTNNYCIHQLFEIQVSKTPDAIAVIFEDRQLTYRELNEKANQLAHYLKELGVKPETLVGICVDRSLEMIVAMLGVLKAGGAYIPLDPAYPKERIAFIITDAQFSILLTQKNLVEQLNDYSGLIVVLDNDWFTIERESNQNCLTEVSDKNLAYIIYTSGSTGKPKGVQIQHNSVVNLLCSMKQEPGINERDTLLAITTFSFDLSVPDWYLPLIVGAKIKLVTKEIASDPKQLAEELSESDITFVQATPSTWRLVIAAGWQGNKRLKMLCGGEALIRSLANQLLSKGASLWHMYGPTETTVWSMIHKVEYGTACINLGHPIANTQIYLMEYPTRRQEDSLKTVPIGKAGEIYIGGDGVSRGYLNRSELTSERFVKDFFSNKLDKRLYKTGDLARYLPDGRIEFLGRIDDQVKVRGYRVEIGEIEEVITQHSNVREVTVIAKKDTSESQSLIAYVVPKTHVDDSKIPTSTENFNTEQIQQWRQVWNSIYSESSENNDSTFNIIGWNNSFTGLPIPTNEMKEWVDCTVERVLSLRPQRVLEIGCGMGLLLFRIAPYCSHYCGIDFSAEAIHYIEQQLKNSKQDLSHVTLFQQTANEIDRLELEKFDTIVINSVIQYFPDIHYLVQVLEKAVNLVKPRGHIFIGDVRSLPLLETFHTAVQLFQASDSLSIAQLKEKIQQRIFQEGELVIDPDFFKALKFHIPRIAHVENLLKRGYSQNEILQFRSDCILYIDTKVEQASQSLYLNWQDQKLSVSEICQFIQDNQPQTLKISNISNPRIVTEIKVNNLLANFDPQKTVEEFKLASQEITTEQGIHPEYFWNLSSKLSYKINITWAESLAEDRYDVIFQHRSQSSETILALPEQPFELKPWPAYVNNSINKKNTLISQLRTFLKDRLPEYMIPSAFVVMKSLPLTPNGKIDRRALPDPKKERPILSNTYIAPVSELEDQLVQIWSQILEIEQIGIQDNFFELGGHSLLAAQLLAQIEKVVQVALPMFYLIKDPTIAGLIKGAKTIQNSGSAFALKPEIEIDWQAEATLDSTIKAENFFTKSSVEPKHIFLTGVTGFLGAFLLDELLKQTSANIYCLVRASSFEQGQQKIQANLKSYSIWNQELNSRIIPVIGDLSKPLLGLFKEDFKVLASKLDLIYHCGAFINLVYPYKTLKNVNVLGTQEVLRLASQGQVTPVHYISTIDVLKPLTQYGNKVVKENEHLASAKELKDGYSQSKWVAEKLIIEARSRGIPTYIYRPGMLTGHSQTGASNINDLMCRMIKGMIQLESAPNLEHWINLIPVDYASQSIVHLSRKTNLSDRVFHIVNPQALRWKNLIDYINNLGYQIKLASHEEWQAKLLKLNFSQDNSLNSMRSLFTEKSENQMTYLETFLLTATTFDCQNTLEELANSSIICQSINEQLIDIYLSFLIKKGFLESSKQYA